MPWFGWLNLLGALVLWLLYMFNHRMFQSGRLVRWRDRVVVIVAMYFIVFGTRGALPDMDGWAQSGAAVYLLALSVWELGAGIVMMATGKYPQLPGETAHADATLDSGVKSIAAKTPAADDAAPGVFDADISDPDVIDLDLDEGTPFSKENRARQQAAISQVFARKSSDLDRLKGLGTLLSGGIESPPEDDGSDWAYDLIGIGLLVVVLALPCFYAVQSIIRWGFQAAALL